MTTAHKAKGREFEIVVLADDFPEVHDKAGEFIGLEDTEANLLYVGLTRAMRVLVRNKTLRDIRKAMGIVSEPKPMVVSTVVEISEQDIDAANDALAMAREDYMTSLDDFYPDSMLQQAWARRVSE
ncbi:hypothetical protein D3C75_758250 [compost metagenome]